MRAIQPMSNTRALLALVLVASSLAPAAWGRQTRQPPPPARVVAPVAVEKAADEATARRRETFQIVWQAVNDHHFDPRFGGVDWDAVKTEFAPLVERAASDRELHALLQRMLDRLGQSHFVVIPPESIASAGGEEDEEAGEGEEDGDDAAAPERPNGADVAERLSHGVGIDLRIINGAPVITEVEPASPAARAGLRPGFVVRSVDGRSMRRAVRGLRRLGAYRPIVLRQIPEELIIGFFNGPPGSTVRVTYLDARDRVRTASLVRERLRGEMSPPLQSLPPQFFRFDSKRLENNVGYIRFNYFVGPVLDKFCAALRSMKDAPGLVIDLRGNRGGMLGMISGMGGLLESSSRTYGAMLTRAGAIGVGVHPQRSPYTGRLVVLVDGSSLSASEILAAGLQESGRALIVGERSAGATLPSVARELPTGGVLQYAFADFVTAEGRRLEGKGVTPDINVRLDRRSLLGGRDPQLAAALAAVRPGLPSGRQVRKAVSEVIAEYRARAAARAAAESKSGGAAGANAEQPAAPSVERRAAEVIEKYVRAIGGREAVEKISSRVSKGTFEGNFAGVKVGGAVEIFEKSPNKAVSLVTVGETGVMRRGYTGLYGFEQIPYYGFRVLEGAELADLLAGSDLHWSIKLPSLYRSIRFVGTEESGDAELHILELTPPGGSPTRLYFDAKTGLLARRDDTTYDDYREVGGVLMPFTHRTTGTVFRLTEIKLNLPVDDAVFAEAKDCFTR